jgi:ABC-2 type transport system ATP-binding protein
MATLVEADRLTKTFGPITAVDGITLKVQRGEVLGFLGPNGAGKSTTMKMLTGFLEPDDGTARIAGISMVDQPKEAKSKLGYLPEGAPAYGDMTVAGFLAFIASVRGFQGAEAQSRVSAAAARAGLSGVIDQHIETLSKGYKRRVGIAQAILHDPEVLILDEPTDGLDPNQKHQVRRLIAEMAKDKAIVISTHILEEVEAVCTRAVIIDRGRIVADGTAEELQRRLPHHNAVAVRLPKSKADAARDAIAALPAIAKVERSAAADGGDQVLLHAVAKSGKPATAEIAAALAAKGLAADEIFIERGKLEDVFRRITSTDVID